MTLARVNKYLYKGTVIAEAGHPLIFSNKLAVRRTVPYTYVIRTVRLATSS
jgi:hypothetical protein